MNIDRILSALPKIKKHLSYSRLYRFVESLKTNSDFEIKDIGKSKLGRPIQYIKIGNGKIKALFIGYPHPNEPPRLRQYC